MLSKCTKPFLIFGCVHFSQLSFLDFLRRVSTSALWTTAFATGASCLLEAAFLLALLSVWWRRSRANSFIVISLFFGIFSLIKGFDDVQMLNAHNNFPINNRNGNKYITSQWNGMDQTSNLATIARVAKFISNLLGEVILCVKYSSVALLSSTDFRTKIAHKSK